MLLAKVYMTLATNPSLRADGISEAQYWQMAYDEAILGHERICEMVDEVKINRNDKLNDLGL